MAKRCGLRYASIPRAGLLWRSTYTDRIRSPVPLRSLAEEQDRRLADAFPRDQHRERAWFNTLNEAYVKARYSKHFEISEEALLWLGERTEVLHRLVQLVCEEHIVRLGKRQAEELPL